MRWTVVDLTNWNEMLMAVLSLWLSHLIHLMSLRLLPVLVCSGQLCLWCSWHLKRRWACTATAWSLLSDLRWTLGTRPPWEWTRGPGLAQPPRTARRSRWRLCWPFRLWLSALFQPRTEFRGCTATNGNKRISYVWANTSGKVVGE